MDCYIDKKTGTYAETLEAVGLASAAHELGFRGVRVKDKGTQFHIHSDQDSGAHSVLSAGYPYIWLKSKEPERPTIRFSTTRAKKRSATPQKRSGRKPRRHLMRWKSKPPQSIPS